MSSHSLNTRNKKTVNHSVHSPLEINKLSSSPWDNISSILSGLQSSTDLRSAEAQFPVKISVFLSGHEQTYPSRFVHIPFQFLLKSQFENHKFVPQLQTFWAETTSILFSRVCWTRRRKWFFFLNQWQRKITLSGELKSLLDLLNYKC